MQRLQSNCYAAWLTGWIYKVLFMSGITEITKTIIKKSQPKQKFLKLGKKNVENRLLVDPMKLYLLPLNIKLGLIKNFVKVKDKNGQGFSYLKEKFPKVILK